MISFLYKFIWPSAASEPEKCTANTETALPSAVISVPVSEKNSNFSESQVENSVAEPIPIENISVAETDAVNSTSKLADIYLPKGDERMDGVTMAPFDGNHPQVLIDTKMQVSSIYSKKKKFPKRNITQEELDLLRIRDQIVSDAKKNAEKAQK